MGLKEGLQGKAWKLCTPGCECWQSVTAWWVDKVCAQMQA